MRLTMLAVLGGALGAGARHWVNQAFAPTSAAPAGVAFPWATLTVNVAGGFLIGFVVVLVQERLGGSPEWRTFLATGILGGFTTFSAFSLDAVNLAAADGALSPRPLVYVAVSVAGAILALIAGLALARAVLT